MFLDNVLLGIVSDRIIISYKPLHVVSSLLICSGRVVYAGDPGFVEKTINTLGGELIDYGRYTVIPGFIDPHIHLDGLSLEDYIVDLKDVRSIKEIYERINSFIKENPEAEIIIGRGWDQDKISEKRILERRELDMISRDKPIVLVRICGHVAVANTKALELLNKVDKNVDPGKGLVFEEKVKELLEAIGIDKQVLRNIVRKQVELASKGITSIGWVSSKIPHLFIEKTIGIRYYLEPNNFSKWVKQIPLKGVVGVDGVKIILDGSLGARTAYLSKPYNDKPDTRGLVNYTEEELVELVGKAIEKKYYTAIHAIGDKALDIVINIYIRLRAYKQRIEHASIIRNNQIPLLKKLDARIVVQPGFILSDTWILDRVGQDRIKWVYRIKSLIENGITVGFSSDAPVEPPNPWRNIYAAVTRGENEGLDIAYHTSNEKIDTITALHLHTKGSAQTLYQEDLGKLEPGYKADYVVVDKNPLELEPRKLLEIKTIETRVSGRKIYP